MKRLFSCDLGSYRTQSGPSITSQGPVVGCVVLVPLHSLGASVHDHASAPERVPLQVLRVGERSANTPRVLIAYSDSLYFGRLLCILMELLDISWLLGIFRFINS